jgi:curved DNA-binding protein
MAEDYYKTLGVRRDASQADIERAYRELARKSHPDLNPDDKAAKAKFQQVQEAFDVLGNTEKRELYDRYGSSFESMGAGGPQGAAWGTRPGAGFGAGAENVDFSQFFGERFGAEGMGGLGDIFGQFRRASEQRPAAAAPRQRTRGEDILHQTRIPLNIAVGGGQIQVTVQRRSGKVDQINVKIPAGIEDGKKIRVRGQGEPPPGKGTPGDILIVVRVDPHPFFTRRGRNLHLKVPVTLGEAALGAKIDLPTPTGTVTLSVPPGTSSGAKLRVKGHGVKSKGAAAGDLLAEIEIVLPKELDDVDRKAIEQLAERHPQQPRADLRW